MADQDQVFAKCAWRLIPFMLVLYLVNFLDRLNVGFAALTMNKDLGFSPTVFGFGAGVFFVGYSLLQVPANVVLARVGARRTVFAIMAAWGAIAASTAFVETPFGFYTLRFLLGVAEAGFFPGMIFYLTLWFPRAYRARFMGIFSGGIPLAGIIGGPLSGAILQMDGMLGLHGWQWLFLIEGMPACVLAVVVLRFLPDGPRDASWLDDGEKRLIAARILAADCAEHSDLWRALRDPRVLALGAAAFGNGLCLYGTTLWLPQIVQSMNFSNFATGYVVALPYLAAIAAMILVGRSSDKRNERIWHVALAWLVAALGFAAASLAQSDVVMLVALGLALMGILGGFGPYYSLPSSFLGGAASAAGVALANSFATAGAFVGPTIIGVLKEDTGGYAVPMAALATAALLGALVLLALGRTMTARPAMLKVKAGAGA
jgi:ACS family tartrate transporter-like MFS transporter